MAALEDAYRRRRLDAERKDQWHNQAQAAEAAGLTAARAIGAELAAEFAQQIRARALPPDTTLYDVTYRVDAKHRRAGMDGIKSPDLIPGLPAEVGRANPRPVWRLNRGSDRTRVWLAANGHRVITQVEAQDTFRRPFPRRETTVYTEQLIEEPLMPSYVVVDIWGDDYRLQVADAMVEYLEGHRPR